MSYSRGVVCGACVVGGGVGAAVVTAAAAVVTGGAAVVGGAPAPVGARVGAGVAPEILEGNRIK